MSRQHRFEAVTAILDCQARSFTAKGKTVLQAGWKEVERLYRMGLKQFKPEDDKNTDVSLPMLQEGQIFETVSASVREGKTSPPKHYTEDARQIPLDYISQCQSVFHSRRCPGGQSHGLYKCQRFRLRSPKHALNL